MNETTPVIDYQSGDGKKRRRYPAWVIVALIITALVGIGYVGFGEMAEENVSTNP